MGRGQELGSLFLSEELGRMGGPSCFLSGPLGPFVLPPRKDGPRLQGWAPLFSLCSQGCSHSVGRGQRAGLPSLGSLHVSFLGSWVGWVGRGQESGLCWAPFMFPSFWVLRRMGGPRQRSWASIGLPSYFLSGLLGWIGSLHVSFFLVGWMGRGQEAGLALGSFHISFLGSWVGWVGRGRSKEAGLPLDSLHISFLRSWVGWVVRGQEAGLALGSLHVSFFLGSWVGWVGRGKEAGLPLGCLHVSLFLGSWVGWVGRGKKAGLPLGFLHISFLGSWVGWVGRGQEAGLPLGSLHVSFFLAPGSDGWAAAKKLGSHWTPFIFPFCALGSDGGPRPRSWARVGLPSCFLLSGLLGRMGGPRPRSWARIGLPSSFLGSWADGWAAAKSWAPFMFPFRRVGSDGWAAATGLGARHVSFLGPGCLGPFVLPPRMDGRAHKAGLQWPPFAAKAAPITKLP